MSMYITTLLKTCLRRVLPLGALVALISPGLPGASPAFASTRSCQGGMYEINRVLVTDYGDTIEIESYVTPSSLFEAVGPEYSEKDSRVRIIKAPGNQIVAEGY